MKLIIFLILYIFIDFILSPLFFLFILDAKINWKNLKKVYKLIFKQEAKMGCTQRGKRDGTGPYKNSYRRKVEGKSIGRRLEKTGRCPKRKK